MFIRLHQHETYAGSFHFKMVTKDHCIKYVLTRKHLIRIIEQKAQQSRETSAVASKLCISLLPS